MAIAVVSRGAVSATASPAAPAFGQPTTAGDLLVAQLYANATAAGNFTCSDPSWTLLVQDVAQGNCQSALFYKKNCGANETAPTFSYSGGACAARLNEYSGADTANPAEQSGAQNGTTSPQVAVTGGADAAAGNLIVTAESIRLSAAGTTVTTDTYNNGAAASGSVQNDATSTQSHYRFADGITTGNGGADQNTVTSSSGGTTHISTVIGSFKAAASLPAGFVTLDAAGLLPAICVEVDATTNPTTGTRTWTNITPHVRQLSFTRSGRNQELNRSTAGSLKAVCDDRGGAITGLGLRKRQWVRVRAYWQGVTYARWQGVIEVLPRKWPGQGADQLVEFQAADVFKVLGLTDLAGQTFVSQRNDQRVSAILAATNLSAGTIDTNTDTADAVTTPFPDESMALDYLLQIEDSENGLLIANPDGSVDFQGRHWRQVHASAPVATFGESGDTIRYLDDAEYDDDDSLVQNVAAVTPFGASSAIVVTNTASTAKYWPTRFDRQLLSSSTPLATAAAQWLSNRYGDPSPRIPTITCELAAVARVDAGLVSTLLAAANSSRFTWTRQASTPISIGVYLEQISETISVEGGSWQWKAQLSNAGDSIAGWVLGTSALGLSTALAY